MSTRRVEVEVESLPDTPMGIPNGRTIVHVMATMGGTTGLSFKGCVLGRDYSEESAISDFIRRANADDHKLNLTRAEVVVVSRRS